jgi:hypothetical protein
MVFQNYHIIIKIYSTFKVKLRKNAIIYQLVLELLVTYFYYIKVLQMLYSTK